MDIWTSGHLPHVWGQTGGRHGHMHIWTSGFWVSNRGSGVPLYIFTSLSLLLYLYFFIYISFLGYYFFIFTSLYLNNFSLSVSVCVYLAHFAAIFPASGRPSAAPMYLAHFAAIFPASVVSSSLCI